MKFQNKKKTATTKNKPVRVFVSYSLAIALRLLFSSVGLSIALSPVRMSFILFSVCMLFFFIVIIIFVSALY